MTRQKQLFHPLLPISLTSCHWPSSNCEYIHRGTFWACQALSFQALVSFMRHRERTWNGSLIEHGYYFPLLFLNPQHNDSQMLWEEDVMGITRIFSVFETQTKTQTSWKSNKSSRQGLLWMVRVAPGNHWGSNSIQYYSTQTWRPAVRVLSKCHSYISRRITQRDVKHIKWRETWWEFLG